MCRWYWSSCKFGVLALLLLLAHSCFAVTIQGEVLHKSKKSPVPPSTAVFPIQGNVYPHGGYYVTLHIGDSRKPYYLDVDTGSDLTWLQCDAPCVRCSPGLPHPLYRPSKKKIVLCKEPICQTVSSNQLDHCRRPEDQCDYEIEYADEGSSLGVLVRDTISLRFANGSLVEPRLVFGCGYDQKGSEVDLAPPTDGILGLGAGKSSVVAQLSSLGLTRNVIGHCFSQRGGGYLLLGNGLIPCGVTWTPMSQNLRSKQYSPGPATVSLGRLQNSVRDLTVVFDSGSSYTYFPNRAYQPVLSSLKKDLVGKPLKESYEDKTLPVCWKGTKRFKHVREVGKYFRPLMLSFGKKAQLEMPPENYLIVSLQGNVCLGILNGTEIGQDDLSIIGDLSLKNLMVIYDNENQQIGWVPADCDRLPKTEDEGIKEDFSLPYAPNMGILMEELPATADSSLAD